MHLLSGPKNQEIIRNADKVAKRKEELAKQKVRLIKGFHRGRKKKRNK